MVLFQISPDGAVSKRSRSSGSLKKSSSSHKKSDVGNFFAPRRRNQSKQLSDDEDASDENSVNNEPKVTDTSRDGAVSKRSRSSGSLKKSSSSHEKSDVADFFTPRCRNQSQQIDDDEDASSEKSVDNEPKVTESIKTENVRRSSRLSAQAAANAIARALQVRTLKHWMYWYMCF